MQIRSPYQISKTVRPPQSASPSEIFRVIGKLMEHNTAFRTEIDQLKTKLNTLQTAPPGPRGHPGLPGKDAVVDHEKIAELLAKKVRMPKDGKDGKAAHGRDGKSVSAKEVVDEIIKTKALKVDHVDGLEQTLSPIRRLAAGFRGGGDTIAAGSGVSISNVNGVKTISATGAGINPQIPVGTVNGSNVTFICTGIVQVAIADGTVDTGASIVGVVNSTITYSVPPQNNVYAF